MKVTPPPRRPHLPAWCWGAGQGWVVTEQNRKQVGPVLRTLAVSQISLQRAV